MTFAIYAGFLLTGIVTTLLGPILPILAARWALADWQAGFLFTLQFLGSMVGAAGSSALVPRRGFRFVLVVGFALMAAGIGLLGAAIWPLALAAVACYGVGLGVTIPTANLFVAETQPTRRAAALNLLNLTWGLGAVACPGLTALAQRFDSVDTFLFVLAAALGFASAAFARLRPAPEQREAGCDEPAGGAGIGALRAGLLVLLGALFFLYVGTENALGGWAAAYARRLAVADAGTPWWLAPSFFWATLLVGRALAPVVLRYLTETALVVLELALATIGTAILVAATTPAIASAGVSLGGLGLATVFPITIGFLSRDFGPLAARAAGPAFMLAGFGGATLPWLVGVVSSYAGSLKVGLAVPLIGCLAMLALHLWYARLARAPRGGLVQAAEKHGLNEERKT